LTELISHSTDGQEADAILRQLPLLSVTRHEGEPLIELRLLAQIALQQEISSSLVRFLVGPTNPAGVPRSELQREASKTTDANEIQQITKALQHHIKTVIGISTHVKVFPADSLQRTETGKARRVLDNRPKQL